MGMGPMGAGFPGDPMAASPQPEAGAPEGGEGAMINTRALQGNIVALRNM